jgi:putative ABC transport system permease protein
MRFEAPAVRIFRALLFLYPAEFREHFGRELCLALAGQLRHGRTPAATVATYLTATAYIFIDAPLEHYYMIRQDLTYAWRTMRREKLTTLAAVLVLALGIGPTTAIFTLVDGLLLRPLPFPDQERLVDVEESLGALAYPNYLDFQSRNRSLEAFALYDTGMATLRAEGQEAERIPVTIASEPLFRVLGVQPLLGRIFSAAEDRPNGPQVVLLGEAFWSRRYGADRAIIGKTISLGGAPARVIGVMPAGFHFPDTAELWTPLQLDHTRPGGRRTDHYLSGIARLRSGVTTAQAQSDLRAIMQQISRENPTETYGQTVNVEPYRVSVTRRVRPVLLTLLGAVGCVLLIACANITNLLLVRATVRHREVAVRGALGASRARLVRQFVIESLLLGLAGATGGVLLAWAAVPMLLRLAPDSIPHWVSFSPDIRVLVFVVLLTLGTGILAGIVPALSSSRLNIVEALKEGGRSATSGSASGRLRAGLVVAEVALSMLLLIGAGLMIRTFLNLQRQNAGFRIENLITLETAAPSDRYPQGPEATQLIRHTLQEFAALPGVVSAAAASGVPLQDRWGQSLTVEGSPELSLKDAPMINHTVVTPGYFQTLEIPIVEGRDFNQQDGKNPRVTIVDAGLARRYWPNASAIGKRVRYGPPEDHQPWHIVVGVVGEARNQTLRELRSHSVYRPYGEFQRSSLAYLLRTSGRLANAEPSLRARMRTIDPAVAISRVVTMQEIVNRTIWQERFFATLFAGFGVLALALALVGLYGVMAGAVTRRRHEMGIRMAMGASAGAIQRMILWQSSQLVAGGLLLGAGAAVALTRILAGQLYEVKATDPETYLAVAVVLSLTALAAGYLPARRATRVDPMVALREE